MLSRMIDRASDFCKYSSATDYRSTAQEESEVWDQVFTSDPDEQDK
jgi:hypothetical protein